MENCDKYEPDNVFKVFELIEFPICFVGLTLSKQIRVERDLYTSAYFKTMHEGTLMVGNLLLYQLLSNYGRVIHLFSPHFRCI